MPRLEHGGKGLPGEGAVGLIEIPAHALDIAGSGRPGHRVGVIAGHVGEGGLAGDLRAASGLVEELGRHAPVTVASGWARISSLTELSSAQARALSVQDGHSAAETVVAVSRRARNIAANRFTFCFLLFCM